MPSSVMHALVHVCNTLTETDDLSSRNAISSLCVHCIMQDRNCHAQQAVESATAMLHRQTALSRMKHV